jgi:hypothetical protein
MMANVQHSALTSADCHEPKHISGTTVADAGKIITPAATAGTSELRKLKVSEIDATSAGQSTWSGWQHYVDNAGTQAITGSASVVTINGLGTGTDKETYDPADASDYWNTSTNKFLPTTLGDSYVLRFNFVVNFTGGTGSLWYDVTLEVATLGVIWGQTFVVPKGTGVDQYGSVVVPIFAGATMLSQGAQIKVAAGSGGGAPTLDLKSKELLIVRTHKGS